MSKHTLKIERILELSNAGRETVANNDRLAGKTAYWLGRLGDFCNAPLKVFKNGQEKALNKIRPEQEKLLKELNNGLDPVKDKSKIEELNRQVQDYNIQYSDLIKELMEQEEEIEIPDFKMSQFIADSEIVYPETLKDIDKEGKEITRKVEITIKKGNSLVPIKFFKLMGEYIAE